MSASTSMDQTSLSFSKTAAIETGEEIFEQKFLVEHRDIRLINFVDQNVKKLHVGDEEGISISNGVGVRSSPRKLQY